MDEGAGSSTEVDEESVNRANAVLANTFDRVNIFLKHQYSLDELRRKVLNELTQSSQNANLTNMTMEEKYIYVMSVQKRLCDLQLLEAASKAPLFGIAKTLFAMTKKRSAPKVEEGNFFFECCVNV